MNTKQPHDGVGWYCCQGRFSVADKKRQRAPHQTPVHLGAVVLYMHTLFKLSETLQVHDNITGGEGKVTLDISILLSLDHILFFSKPLLL